MRYWLKQLHREEDGVTLVIVVLSLIALFGMLVLVVDVGGLLYKRRELVNGSDAAALAAAQTCSVPLTQDSSIPEVQADGAAISNVNGLAAADGTIVDGIATCRQPRGFVTVRYAQQQQLFFAPVLGFGNANPVSTAATAAWGPLGAGNAVPIVLESSQFQGPCDIPDNVNIGDECNFWYNNGNFAIGDANWGFLNLDQWDVAKDANCSSAGGSAQRGDYILHDFPKLLPLRDPGPTYVCGMTGHATSNWQDLFDRMSCAAGSAYRDGSTCPGDVLLMPVNECAKQVDKNGNVMACGTGTPDKYAIIGFTTLQLSAIYRGDDTAAIGIPGTAAQTGNCGNNGTDLGPFSAPLFQKDLNAIADNQCGAPAADTIDQIDNVRVTRKQGSTTTVYVKCPTGVTVGCDYTLTVDGVGHTILTWVNAVTRPQNNKKIEMDWHVPGTAGTPGACGIRAPDANAICLTTTWLGYTSQNAPIGSGPDTGTKGFLLCDFTFDSCPAGVKP